MIRIGINGFGRIGRALTRLVLASNDEFEIVVINDLGSNEALSHLFEFDSIHGKWKGEVSFNEKALEIDGRLISVMHQSSPQNISWADYNLDLVVDSTGRFKTIDELSGHLKGVPRVLLSAVGELDIKTIVLGVNEGSLDGSERIISNASCTTNCAAPLVKIIDDNMGIESGSITTVHSYTSDQSLHDRPHADLRRARAAALSMIPTTTGAAKAITRIFPHLDGVIGGAGIRVPVPNGSLTDITYIVKKRKSIEEVNQLFREAAESDNWKGILEYTEKPMVSIDIVGNTHSCVFDAQLTSVIGNMVKVVGWYDNEMGYASRLKDLIQYWSKLWD